MAKERGKDGDVDEDGDGAAVPLSSEVNGEIDLVVASDLCVVFLLLRSLFGRLSCPLYIGPFMKVVPFDLGKAVALGMGGLRPYQCSPNSLMLLFVASFTWWIWQHGNLH